MRVKERERSEMHRRLLDNEYELSAVNQTKKWMINFEDLQFGDKISEGASGIVYR